MPKKMESTKSCGQGEVKIISSFRKTAVFITTANGETIAWASSATDDIYESTKVVAAKAVESGIQGINVTVKGHGKGRESAIRGLLEAGLKIRLIRDRTPIPHNSVAPCSRRHHENSI